MSQTEKMLLSSYQVSLDFANSLHNNDLSISNSKNIFLVVDNDQTQVQEKNEHPRHLAADHLVRSTCAEIGLENII